MEHNRDRIEAFLRRWRSRYEGNRVLQVLTVAVAILLTILLAHRVLRVYRALAVPVLIGAILVAGWLLIGPLLTIPRFSTEGPVVRNGVAAIVACGKKRGLKDMYRTRPLLRYPTPQQHAWLPSLRKD
jgi:hypothetical protein